MTAELQWRSLAIETSGHFHRIYGSTALRSELTELLGRFDVVGTTAFSLSEFDLIVSGLFNQVGKEMEKFPYPDRGRPFSEIEAEVSFQFTPFPKGGPKLKEAFFALLGKRFEGCTPTPRQIANECYAQLETARILVRKWNLRNLFVHDSSTCCFWKSSDAERCEDESRNERCKLEKLCGAGRLSFLSLLESMANARLSESEWIGANIGELRHLEGRNLLRRIARNPNNVGDAVIFSEIPKEWSILSRDRAFVVMQSAHHPDQKVFAVRAPRIPMNSPCGISYKSGEQAELSGTILNASMTGTLIESSERLEVGTAVHIASSAFMKAKMGEVLSVERSSKGWLCRLHFQSGKGKPPRYAAPTNGQSSSGQQAV